MGRISQHFYINVNRNPDRDGFCARLTRQTSQLVGSGLAGQRYSKRSTGYYPARGSDQWDYYPGGSSDEISLDDQILESLIRENHQRLETKRTRDVLKIIAVDQRPKCQPIGAQVDCRLDARNTRMRAGRVLKYFQVRSRSEAQSWRVVRPPEM